MNIIAILKGKLKAFRIRLRSSPFKSEPVTRKGTSDSEYDADEEGEDFDIPNYENFILHENLMVTSSPSSAFLATAAIMSVRQAAQSENAGPEYLNSGNSSSSEPRLFHYETHENRTANLVTTAAEYFGDVSTTDVSMVHRGKKPCNGTGPRSGSCCWDPRNIRELFKIQSNAETQRNAPQASQQMIIKDSKYPAPTFDNSMPPSRRTINRHVHVSFGRAVLPKC